MNEAAHEDATPKSAPQVQTLNRLFACSVAFFCLAILTAFLESLSQNLLWISVAFGLLGHVCFCLFIRAAWTLIPPQHARMRPGTAFVLTLIPLVNFVGNFFSVWGLTRDLNSFTRAENLQTRPAHDGLALATCIFAPLTPLTAGCAALPYFILWVLTFVNIHRSATETAKALAAR